MMVRRFLRAFLLLSISASTAGARSEDGADGASSETCAADDPSCGGDAFASLIAWMQDGMDKYLAAEHREDAPRLDEVLDRRDRTMVAKRDLHQGELLMRIPTKRLMHAGYYKENWEGSNATIAPILDAGLDTKVERGTYIAPQTWVALYMMEHRRMGRQSEWFHYLDLLPKEFPSCPIFYSDEDFDQLKGSSFVPRAKKHKETLEAQFEAVSKIVPGFADNYTVSEFLWARAAIATRTFGWNIPGIGDGVRDFMVPLGDMFNHRSPKMLEWIFNTTTDSLDYWVREEVSAGQELLISYGTKSNGEYLLHYGFAVQGLPQRSYPVCTVRVVVNLDGVLDHDAKRKWLIKAAFTPTKVHKPYEFTLRDTWEKDPANMLAYARLLELPDIDAVKKATGPGTTNCKRISVPPGLCAQPISLVNERAALARCLSVVDSAMKAYPTSLEEDEAILPGLEGTALFLVTLRRDEKFVLRYWQRFFGLALEMVDAKSPSKIESRCGEVFGEAKCSAEENPYMRDILFVLLGGTDKSASHWAQLSLWIKLVLAPLALCWFSSS